HGETFPASSMDRAVTELPSSWLSPEARRGTSSVLPCSSSSRGFRASTRPGAIHLLDTGDMAQRRENHPGQRHGRGRGTAPSRTEQPFVRVEGERRVRWIYDEDYWQHVHRTGRRLVCPVSGCTQRLKANQNRHGTRYLSNCGDSSGCTH